VPSCPQRSYVSGTYDTSIVAPYFDIATKYGFANYFFQTNQGPSMPAHEFLFTGTSAPTGIGPTQEGQLNFFQAENPLKQSDTLDTGCTSPASETVPLIDQFGVEKSGSQYNLYPCFYHNSLPTLLDAANPRVTWKYYTNETSQTATNGIWNAPAAIGSICLPTSQYDGKCSGTDYVNNVVVNNPAQVLLDLGLGSLHQCALRNVSWVIPNYDRSDHPGFDPGQDHSTETEAGPAWVADIINGVGQTTCTDQVGGKNVPYWQDTAIFVVWDDWGGFWDHVAPYEVLVQSKTQNTCDPINTFGCGYVSGFRVPFLVVSAYTGVLNQQNGTIGPYVSGACGASPLPPCPNKVPPYIHDFGSILAFIENNFLGFNQIGQINPAYKFADNVAPDFKLNPPHVPLADFFPLTSARPFQAITLPAGAPDANYFLNYNGPLGDPDNDVIDND
jgi:hypothetical protein